MVRATRPPQLKRISQSDNSDCSVPPCGLAVAVGLCFAAYALTLLVVLAVIAAVVIYEAH